MQRVVRIMPLTPALKGVWYADDSQIVGYGELGKWYAGRPRIEVTMQEIEEVQHGEMQGMRQRNSLD